MDVPASEASQLALSNSSVGNISNAQTHEAPEATTPGTAVQRFLLVEDSESDGLLALHALEDNCNCTVTRVTAGEEGLRLLTADDFDFAVINQFLPDLEGVDITHRARSCGVTTPVVIVTGLGAEDVVVRALRSGADDHIVKSQDYARVLPEIVRQVQARRALRQRNEELKNALIDSARLAAIGEVTAGIAHEIRNPMTVLLGMAQHLSDHADSLKPAEIKTCADAILRNGRHLTRSLEDALSGVSRSEREIIDLHPLITETLAFMRFNEEFRHRVETRFVATAGPGELVCMGDSNMLRQVFINILRNAAQSIAAAGRSDGEVVVSAEVRDCQARIAIRDNGCGITQDALPRLFQSGFSTKRGGPNQSRGSGLGLSICRRIIAHHGGSVQGANRNDGLGAEFTIELPLASQK